MRRWFGCTYQPRDGCDVVPAARWLWCHTSRAMVVMSYLRDGCDVIPAARWLWCHTSRAIVVMSYQPRHGCDVIAAHLVMSELMPLFERIRAAELAGVHSSSQLATIVVGHSPEACLASHCAGVRQLLACYCLKGSILCLTRLFLCVPDP